MSRGEFMLSLIERRSEIVRQTESKGKVGVEELARMLNVSQVTIRNDLNALNSKGLVVRARGGAVASNRLTRELSMQERHKDNLSVKRRLGRAVADLIGNDVHTIALDSGTTTEEVALCLLDHRDLTVVTNGLNVASALARAQNIEILVTGGILRTRSLSFFGKHAEEGLRHMHFDKLVLGADGIDIGVGVTTHFAQEASLNRRMCNMASEIILVSDSSKFGKRCSHIICRFDRIDTLVTDAGIPPDIARQLANQGISLHIVDENH